jgi:hypothetical protein
MLLRTGHGVRNEDSTGILDTRGFPGGYLTPIGMLSATRQDPWIGEAGGDWWDIPLHAEGSEGKVQSSSSISIKQILIVILANA